jgi:hypothetical protein
MGQLSFGVDALDDTPIAFLVITYLAIGLRLYTRIWVKKNYGWDDTLIIIAQLSFTGWCASLLVIYHMTGSSTGFQDIDEPRSVAKVIP